MWLAAGSDVNWKAVANMESGACLLEALAPCGYKDENFQALLWDIQEQGVQDFTNAIPTAAAPRR